MVAPVDTYQADSAAFDGDYMLRGADLTGNADPSVHCGSFWVRFLSGDGVLQKIYENSGAYYTIEKTTGNKIHIKTTAPDSTSKSDMLSTSSYTVASGWIHVCYRIGNGSGDALYINDVDDLGAFSSNNKNIDATRANHAIGSDTSGNNKLQGLLFDFVLPGNVAPILPATESNRRLFINRNKKPVYLGENAEIPFGADTFIIFAHLDKGEAAANFATNAGTGGNFTVTGSLATGSTSATDYS